MNQYEAMFLIDPNFGASFEACEEEVKRLMDRAEAEILFCRKWDERRLAYRVKGRKRGVYILVYFKAAPDKISPLHRDVQISEDVLRVLVLRADGVTEEMMERAANIRAESARYEGRDDAPYGRRERPGREDRPKATPKTEAAPAQETAPAEKTAPAEETAVATAEAPTPETKTASEPVPDSVPVPEPVPEPVSEPASEAVPEAEPPAAEPEKPETTE